ncbi:hypothetical protein F4781DRAFT_428899 [Annulohypoxylon bovei var. microspora]|nr:hypothetical protein F4781DRAFT_428899 [Annulohypoxylon bovei var. microspora]
MSSTTELWHDARNPPADPKNLSFKNKAVLVTGAYEILDLATFASVIDFVKRVKERVPLLHVIQHAGGVAPWTYAKSPDNYEMALQVDVLSPTLLTLLLLPKLRETAAATVSSPDGYRPHISFLDSISIFEVPGNVLPSGGQTLVQRCDDESKWHGIEQYYPIKLAT